MREVSKMRKKLLLVATFLLAFMIFLVPIRAVESERCIIKIHLEDLQVQSSNMNGVKFYVYKIGEIDKNGDAKIYPKYGYETYPQNAHELDLVAKMISKKLEDKPILSNSTDAKGEMELVLDEKGVYLLMADDDNAYGVISPFIVHLPYYQTIEDVQYGPLYTVDVEPKASPKPNTPGESDGPNTPDKPNNPNNPNTPDTPTGGDTPTDEKTPGKETQTGDSSNTYLYLLLIVISGASMCIWKVKKGRGC